MSGSMWEVLDEYEAQASSGGAIIGKIEFSIGYKAFVTGKTQEESWFAFTAGDDASKKGAEAACKKFIEAAGADPKTTRPQLCVQFRVFKASVLGREVTWKGDRFFTFPIWTPAYKEVVKPALKAAGVTTAGTYWGRIGFANDPSGRTEVGPDGETRPSKIEHLVEVYKDEATAAAAAGSAASSAASPATSAAATTGKNGAEPEAIPGVPAGWDKQTWDQVKPEIKADYVKRLDGKTDKATQIKVKAALATDYSITLADVNNAVE